MARWSDLRRDQQRAIIVFIVIILIILAIAWYGYFTGSWESSEGISYGYGTLFSYQ